MQTQWGFFFFFYFYLSLLCQNLFVVQPALLVNITEGDDTQLRGGVALGSGVLLGLQTFQRLKHIVEVLCFDLTRLVHLQKAGRGDLHSVWPFLH